MSKKIVKNIISIILVAILLFWLTLLDWNHLFNKKNSGAFLGILAPLLIIISLQMKNKKEY